MSQGLQPHMVTQLSALSAEHLPTNTGLVPPHFASLLMAFSTVPNEQARSFVTRLFPLLTL